MRWRRASSGLWLPQESKEVATENTQKVQNWSAVVQALATVLAVAVALPGIWFSLHTLREQQSTLREQQRINESQIAVDQIAQERFIHRYVSRVTWWEISERNRGPGVISLIVENGSVAPIQRILVLSFASSTDRKYIQVGDLEPCTRARIEIPAKKIRDGYEAWGTRTVYFSDPVDTWREDYAAPPARSDYPDPIRYRTTIARAGESALITPVKEGSLGDPLVDHRQPASGCGDSA